WDLASGQVMETLDAPAGISSLEFSPDGKILVWASDGKIQLWDLAASKARHAPLVHPGVRTLSFSRDGKLLASGGADGAGRLWDLVTGKEKLALRRRPVTVLAGASGSGLPNRALPTLVAFRPGGTRLATASGAVLMLWRSDHQPVARTVLEEEACSV